MVENGLKTFLNLLRHCSIYSDKSELESFCYFGVYKMLILGVLKYLPPHLKKTKSQS